MAQTVCESFAIMKKSEKKKNKINGKFIDICFK